MVEEEEEKDEGSMRPRQYGHLMPTLRGGYAQGHSKGSVCSQQMFEICRLLTFVYWRMRRNDTYTAAVIGACSLCQIDKGWGGVPGLNAKDYRRLR